MNPITEKIFYIDEGNQNQKFIISAMTANPIVWQVSKCETMLMGEFGLMRLTFVQTAFNKSVDYVDYNALNPDGTKDAYAMYANYFESTVAPEEDDIFVNNKKSCVLSSSTNTIKSGGSYKTITAIFYDENGIDVTNKYMSKISLDSWRFYVEGEDITQKNLISVIEQSASNKIKIKFEKNDRYLTKILKIQCLADDMCGELMLEITNL